MQYKMIYGVLHFDEYGDIRYEIITPMLYDTRHTNTREMIIEQIKDNMYRMTENNCEMRFGRPVRNAPNYTKLEQTNNRFLHDRAILFNQMNDLTQLASFHYSEEDKDLYIYGSIYEITPELFKTSESDYCHFSESLEAKHRFFDEAIYGNLMFKDMYFISNYTIVPDYDFDERYDYCGGFKTISKNLYELLRKEQKDFPDQAKSFYEYSYRDVMDVCDFEQLRIHNDLTMMQIARRGRVNLDNVIRNNYGIRVEDGNGWYVGCTIMIVPVVVSYKSR